MICLYAVDLNKFKKVLEKENILVWNQVNGTKMRIHGGNYEISMIVSVAENMKWYIVKGWYPFEFVVRIIEDGNHLARGCYKLIYKLFGRDTLIDRDRSWLARSSYVFQLECLCYDPGSEEGRYSWFCGLMFYFLI